MSDDIIPSDELAARAREILKKPYATVFIKDPETGSYTIAIAEFPGCVAEGDTLAEALDLVDEAAGLWLAACLDAGTEIPPPRECVWWPTLPLALTDTQRTWVQQLRETYRTRGGTLTEWHDGDVVRLCDLVLGEDGNT